MLDLGLTFTKQDALFDAQDIHLPLALGSEPGDGVHVTDHVIAYVKGPDVKVYDRVCNHNGGRLISLGGRTICPLHGWELDPAKGRYLTADFATGSTVRDRRALGFTNIHAEAEIAFRFSKAVISAMIQGSWLKSERFRRFWRWIAIFWISGAFLMASRFMPVRSRAVRRGFPCVSTRWTTPGKPNWYNATPHR